MIIQAIPVFALTGQTLAMQNLSTSGIIARTGAGTLSARTLTGTTNQVSVSNGDGIAGNPTFSLPQNIHSGSTPSFAGALLNTAASSAVLNVGANASGHTHLMLALNSGVSSGYNSYFSIGKAWSADQCGFVGFHYNTSGSFIGFPIYGDTFGSGSVNIYGKANLTLGCTSGVINSTGANVITAKNGTAPTGSATDCFQLYSADQAAGNACAHFRTENGKIIKLYQQNTITPPGEGASLGTVTTAVNSIITALINCGLIASS